MKIRPKPGSIFWHIETVGIAVLLIFVAAIAGYLLSKVIG